MSALDTALEQWRRREQESWRSTVRVDRPGGPGSFDPETGQIESSEAAVVYEGPGQVRSHEWQGADVQAGATEVRIRGVRAKLPHDTDVRRNDLITVLSSEHDAGIVGRSYRVTDVLYGDWQVNRVALAEDLTGEPGEAA